MNEIKWKHYPIRVNVDNVKVSGEIVYWSKDYYVRMTHPMKEETKCIHMMYMVPVRFVTPLDEKSETLVDKDIVEDCKKDLVRLYNSCK
jgi:hypothetical protein